MNELLLEEASPYGNIYAVVGDDDRVVYFYLHFRDLREDDGNMSVRACWVRNRLAATQEVDVEAMEHGRAPLLPAEFCMSAGTGPPLDAAALRVVWFEECDAAALLEGNEILAVIPAWSGQGGFHGYARDCRGQGPYAWELGPARAMRERVEKAAAFWKLWDDPDYWQRWRDKRIAALESVLGRHAKYYAIDGDEFPPRAMLRFDLPNCYVLVTVGVSLFCQPSVEQYFDDPSPYRRIELAAAVASECSEGELNRLGSYISGQSRYPWMNFAALGHGHTMPCDSTPPSCGGKQFPAVLLATELAAAPKLVLPTFRGDPVNLLWLFPIAAGERDWAIENSTTGLMERLAAAGHDYVIRDRSPLAL